MFEVEVIFINHIVNKITINLIFNRQPCQNNLELNI